MALLLLLTSVYAILAVDLYGHLPLAAQARAVTASRRPRPPWAWLCCRFAGPAAGSLAMSRPHPRAAGRRPRLQQLRKRRLLGSRISADNQSIN